MQIACMLTAQHTYRVEHLLARVSGKNSEH
jgi:hypothetical protein